MSPLVEPSHPQPPYATAKGHLRVYERGDLVVVDMDPLKFALITGPAFVVPILTAGLLVVFIAIQRGAALQGTLLAWLIIWSGGWFGTYAICALVSLLRAKESNARGHLFSIEKMSGQMRLDGRLLEANAADATLVVQRRVYHSTRHGGGWPLAVIAIVAQRTSGDVPASPCIVGAFFFQMPRVARRLHELAGVRLEMAQTLHVQWDSDRRGTATGVEVN